MAKQDPRTLSDSADAAAIASLRYVNDAEPGLRRRRTGAGFGYRDAAGHAVTDRATLARIRALAIPPAYEDVWICADPRGHIQATGHDDAGRKQYIYHDAWREHISTTDALMLSMFEARSADFEGTVEKLSLIHI